MSQIITSIKVILGELTLVKKEEICTYGPLIISDFSRPHYTKSNTNVHTKPLCKGYISLFGNEEMGEVIMHKYVQKLRMMNTGICMIYSYKFYNDILL